MTSLVILSERLGPVTDVERQLESLGAEVRGAGLWTHEEIAANAADAGVIILGAVEPFDAAAIESLPKLRAIVRRGVGVDNVDVAAATARGVLVANVPDASVEEVSDHALALLLAIERSIPALDRAVHGGRWLRDPSGVDAERAAIRRFNTLTLGVVGFGRIGRVLVRKARAIYRDVLVSDPIASADDAAALSAELVELDELARRSEHVSVHAPHLTATHHLVNEAFLARLPAGSVVVNTSRGGLVDEAALIAAIERGELRGAGLDVSEREPLPADDPLLGTERVVLTAHSAASSTTTKVELVQRSVDAAAAILRGEAPESLVNPTGHWS